MNEKFLQNLLDIFHVMNPWNVWVDALGDLTSIDSIFLVSWKVYMVKIAEIECIGIKMALFGSAGAFTSK